MAKKIKLLVVLDMLFPYTGITKFLKEVLPRLKDFDITIAYPEKQKRLKLKGIKESVFPYNVKIFELPIIDFKKKGVLEKLVAKSDIVWVQFISPLSMLAINYSKKYHKKVLTLAFFHIFEDEIFYAKALLPFKFLRVFVRMIADKYYNKCNILLVPAKNVGEKVRRMGIATRQRIVPLGVGIKKVMRKETARKKIGIKKDKFVIVSIGRLSKEKGIDTLIKAYEEFKKKHKDVLLLLVADGSKAEMKKLRKIKDIKITGYVDDVVPYLSASDIFVLPSVTETTSLSTLEAMYVGLPIIVTKVGYVNRYVRNMRNGLFFEMGNVDNLVKKIRVLYKNKKLRERLGKAAKKTARNFSWSRTAIALRKIFISVVNKKRK